MKKIIPFVLLLVVIVGISVFVIMNMNKADANTSNNTNSTSENNNNINASNNNSSNDNNEEDMTTMKILIDNKEYEVDLINSVTLTDILNMKPLDLKLVRYAGHEYYSELPSKPTMDSNTTSKILAGHIYYWDGWNAFVINFEDYDITPYKVVHIGEIKDKSIIEYLENAGNEINVKLEGE